jgi:HPt (histidine-containing phosphotransfer) domain-containing protein
MSNADPIVDTLEAKAMLQDLFDHMTVAILAFDAAGVIRGPASRQAKVIFERDTLEGCSVRDLLYPHAPAYDVDAASFSEWMDLAFHTPPAEWAACERYAPREVVVARKRGEPTPLQLEFRPLVREGAMTHLMLLASDVTLARRLREAVQIHEAEHAKRVTAMRRLIAGGTQVFLAFVDSAGERIKRCEAVLFEHRGRLPTDAVDELFRQVHTIRGEARAFDLVELEGAAQSLEDALDSVRNAALERTAGASGAVGRGQDRTGGLEAGVRLLRGALERGCEMLVAASPAGASVFDQATVVRSALRELTEYTAHRTDYLGQLVARLTAVPLGVVTAGVVESGPLWAASEGNRVIVDVSPRELMVPEAIARILPGVLTHLVRNAIAHGIEPPEQRRAAGKPEHGTVRIAAEPMARGIHFYVEDDGRGIDVTRVLEQAKDPAGSHGATELVFRPGVSTRDVPDAMAGRGVGLDAARRELALVHYDVTSCFAPGQWTRFTLVPMTEGSRESDTGNAWRGTNVQDQTHPCR